MMYIVTFFLFCSNSTQFYTAVGPMGKGAADGFYRAFTDNPYTLVGSRGDVECKFDFVQIKEWKHKI